MQIRVIYTEQSAGKVDAKSLNYLIENGKIAAYYLDGWISVGGKKTVACQRETAPVRSGSPELFSGEPYPVPGRTVCVPEPEAAGSVCDSYLQGHAI
jgi:hypothetical protein